jgi:putative FmdB family regulatory protein
MDASTAFIIADPQLSAGLVNMGVKAVPIYEYRCDSCAHELEKIQKMNDDMLVDCPECDEPALKKLISAAAFRLKGSGWYETDFKKDNKRNLAESTNKESTSSATANNKSSDSAGKKADTSSSQSDVKKSEPKPAAKSAANGAKNA